MAYCRKCKQDTLQSPNQDGDLSCVNCGSLVYRSGRRAEAEANPDGAAPVTAPSSVQAWLKQGEELAEAMVAEGEKLLARGKALVAEGKALKAMLEKKGTSGRGGARLCPDCGHHKNSTHHRVRCTGYVPKAQQAQARRQEGT